jgi:hypothetical protein
MNVYGDEMKRESSSFYSYSPSHDDEQQQPQLDFADAYVNDDNAYFDNAYFYPSQLTYANI